MNKQQKEKTLPVRVLFCIRSGALQIFYDGAELDKIGRLWRRGRLLGLWVPILDPASGGQHIFGEPAGAGGLQPIPTDCCDPGLVAE